MFKFSPFLKKKKLLFFAFLIVFVLFTAIPNTTFAAPTGCNDVESTSGWCNTHDNALILDSINYSPERGSLKDISITNPGDKFAMIVGKAFINGAFKLAALAEIALSFILGTVLSKPITTDTNFTPAWGAVRDLGNMLLVLGFVIVGIATALRIQSYAAKQLLWKLILIALFINFSSVFCGLIIDASNLVTSGLIKGGSQANMPYVIINNIYKVTFAKETQTYAASETGLYMIECIMYSFVYLGVAFTFLYLLLILIARYAILTMLWVLSPLAFAFWVFPASKNLWSDWWKHFIKWCFIGVFGSFALWMANIILAAQPIFKNAGSNGAMSASSPDATWNIMVSCALVLMFLVAGFKMSASKTGVAAMATTAVMGIASGGAMLAAGAVAGGKGGAKALDRLTGGRGAAVGQSISNTTGRAMERFGLRATGTTASANSKQVESEAGLMSKEYTAAKATGDQGSIDRIRKLATNGRGSRGAAAMKVLADAKDIGTTFGTTPPDLQRASDRMSNAEAYGATGIRSATEKLDPRLAGYNPQSIAKHGSASAAVANAYSQANVSDIRNFSNDALKDPAFIRNTSANKIGRAGLEMSSSQISAVKSTHTAPLMAEWRAAPRGSAAAREAGKKYHEVVGL
jgi:hypothetical protein